MIEVLIHQDRPLLGRELAEEEVWMRSAAGRTGRNKAVDGDANPAALLAQFAFVADHELGVGGRIAADRGIVFEDERLDEPANDPGSQPGATRYLVAGGNVERHSAVRHRLRGVHLTPQTRTVRC